MASNLEQFVRHAKDGDQHALEMIIAQIQDKVYGLALRMLGQAEDAEDETQEILIKVITHLSEFREESAFTSWVYRISCNHLLTTRKRNIERMGMTFEFLDDFAAAEAEKTYPLAVSGQERAVLQEEARLDCLQAVVACLETEMRIAFILGDIFGVTSNEGAYILDIKPEAFRKRLSRARERIQNFMVKNCGLVNKNNPCRCENKAGRDLQLGSSNPKKKSFVEKKSALTNRAEAMTHLNELSEIERATALFRSYPEYQSPESFKDIVKGLIDSGKYRFFMA